VIVKKMKRREEKLTLNGLLFYGWPRTVRDSGGGTKGNIWRRNMCRSISESQCLLSGIGLVFS
jgi:hypothetical protein